MHSIIKKTFLILSILILALVSGGCSSTSTTPAGGTCTHVSGDMYEDGCYYFMNDGVSVPCHADPLENNLCQNAIGPFYDYNGIATYRCLDKDCTSHTPGTGLAETCSSKFTYNDLADNGQAWEAINQLQDQNTTQSPISTNFISTSATTVHVSFSASASINVGGSLDALYATVYANVHAQVNSSVSKTASTVVGNEVTMTIPAGGTAYGVYGVRVQVATGNLQRNNMCNGQTNYGDVQTYVPIASGWCVWLSGQKPCRVVQGN